MNVEMVMLAGTATIFGRGVIYGMKSDYDGVLRTWEVYVFKQ